MEHIPNQMAQPCDTPYHGSGCKVQISCNLASFIEDLIKSLLYRYSLVHGLNGFITTGISWQKCCKRAYGLGSQCRPNECLFGSGKPQGVRIRVGRGQMGKRGKCKSQFTSNPRKKWTDPVTARRVPSKWKWEQGEQGEQGDHRVHNLSILCI
jgi:hypothetical protein